MTKLVVDPSRSRVSLHTFAEGLFSRLAHDLELVCGGVSGTAERLGGDRGSASLQIPVLRIEVGGTLKNKRVDPRGLSPSERQDCVCKMRKDVFHVEEGRADAIVQVEATLEAGTAQLRIVPPNGTPASVTVAVKIEHGASGTRVSGRFELSLSAIGADPVKGPMNAFRVKDRVEVLFDFALSADVTTEPQLT